MALWTVESQAAISHNSIPKPHAFKPCTSRTLRVSSASALFMFEVGDHMRSEDAARRDTACDMR